MPKVNKNNGAQDSKVTTQPSSREKALKALAKLAELEMKRRNGGTKPRFSTSKKPEPPPTATVRPTQQPLPPPPPPVTPVEEELPPQEVTIEGISLAAGESPVTTDTASDPAPVSIVQDASDEELKRLVLERTRGPLPVILRATKLPELSPGDVDTFLEVPQFEKQMLSEAIVGGLQKVKSALLTPQMKAAEEEQRLAFKSIDGRVDALAYVIDSMDTAASGLNVSRVSSQIMQRAGDSLAAIVVPTESSNDALPSTIDGFISLTYPRVNVDAILTNTGRLALIAQDTFLACLTSHPTTLTNVSRPPISAASLFSVPGAYRYDPDGPGSRPEADIPTVNRMFARNERSSTGLLKGSRNGANPGFITLDPNTSSTAATQDEMWDDIVHSICALSNEMILSAGIGRLQGSKLGNRFLERKADRPQQYDPFTRALGFPPGSTSEAISRFVITGPDRPGSYFDYLALGEEVPNRELIVMPFETNTIVYNDTPYVSGRQYFVEMATQLERPELRGALRRFSTRYSEVVKDVSAYLTEIMALDVKTPLAPELLFARILQDFKRVVSSLSDGVSESEKPGVFVAALFALSGFGDKSTTPAKRFDGVEGRVLVSDVLKMSVVRALRSLDDTLTDTTFVLSKKSTEYSTEPGQDNPEIALKTAVESLGGNTSWFTGFGGIDRSSSNSRVVLGSTVNRLIDASGRRYQRFSYSTGGSTTSRPNVFLDGAREINLVNLVAQTVREVQKEALNLAQRGGATSDYRNSTGGTLMSDCDDDRLIDVITTIYTNLAYLLLPVAIFNDGANGSVGVLCDVDAARLGVAVIDDIENSLINGTRITADDIQSRRDIDPSTSINISPLGDNTAKTTSSDLADVASRMTRHRYYIKAGLKILEATSSGVTASSSKAARLFEVISGDVTRKDLKGPEAVLYDMFVTEIESNRTLLRNLSSHQVNLCATARKVYGTPGAVEMRKDVAPVSSERLALRDFTKEVYGRNTGGLQVLSVGIPNGLLDSLYNPALEIGDGQESIVASRGTEADSRRRRVRIEIDRFDNVYFNATSTVTANLFGTSPSETEFDPEVFILPGDISYDPRSWPAGSVTVMDAILRSTTFSRVRRGRFIEKVTGDAISPQEIGLYFNVLRSYLLDLFLYDAAGIRHLDGTPPPGPPQLSQAGYEALRAASSNQATSKALFFSPGFVDIFNSTSRRVKSGEDLRSVLAPSSPLAAPRFNRSDITFAGLLACASPVCDPVSIVAFRPYERVYHFLYDESVIRNQVTGDTLDIKARRRQFDIYTLSARVSYGGGTSGS